MTKPRLAKSVLLDDWASRGMTEGQRFGTAAGLYAAAEVHGWCCCVRPWTWQEPSWCSTDNAGPLGVDWSTIRAAMFCTLVR